MNNLKIVSPTAASDQPLKSQTEQLRESFSHIVLNELETETALAQAREKKDRHERNRAYSDKVKLGVIRQSIPAEALELRAWYLLEQRVPKSQIETDGEFARVLKLLSLYFAGDLAFEEYEDGYSLQKGLLLWGHVGCGKTTLMQLYNLNPKQSYQMVSCRTVVNDFRRDGVAGIDRFSKPELEHIGANYYFGQKLMGTCFDDLGTEENAASFGNRSNVLADVLLDRYDTCIRVVETKNDEGTVTDAKRYRDYTHVTTNLKPEQIEADYGTRLRSRFREMFNLVVFHPDSKDMRR
jgi:energy-coupling factor transporter ATP-binding protein EcfA2